MLQTGKNSTTYLLDSVGKQNIPEFFLKKIDAGQQPKDIPSENSGITKFPPEESHLKEIPLSPIRILSKNSDITKFPHGKLLEKSHLKQIPLKPLQRLLPESPLEKSKLEFRKRLSQLRTENEDEQTKINFDLSREKYYGEKSADDDGGKSADTANYYGRKSAASADNLNYGGKSAESAENFNWSARMTRGAKQDTTPRANQKHIMSGRNDIYEGAIE